MSDTDRQELFAIAEQAAAWLDEPPTSPEEQAESAHWLTRSSQHDSEMLLATTLHALLSHHTPASRTEIERLIAEAVAASPAMLRDVREMVDGKPSHTLGTES